MKSHKHKPNKKSKFEDMNEQDEVHSDKEEAAAPQSSKDKNAPTGAEASSENIGGPKTSKDLAPRKEEKEQLPITYPPPKDQVTSQPTSKSSKDPEKPPGSKSPKDWD